MGMTINTNVMAINAQRNLAVTGLRMSKAMERLSSGFRINRAADDAAGLAISEKLRSQINGLAQASRNAQDGISMVQSAEGALTETHSILQRMRELAVQASTSTLTDSDRTQIQEEVAALISEINRIGEATNFNGTKLLNGGLGSTVAPTSGAAVTDGVSKLESTGASAGVYTFAQVVGTAGGSTAKVTLTRNADGFAVTLDNIAQLTGLNTSVLDFGALGVRVTVNSQLTTGAGPYVYNLNADTITVSGGSATLVIGSDPNDNNQKLSFSVNDMRATALGVAAVTVATQTGANAAVTSIDAALTSVTTQRSKLGAIQNRLEHTVASLGVSVENLAASDARIREADIAVESSSLVTAQILQQAGTAVLAQANASPQAVLSLLRG